MAKIHGIVFILIGALFTIASYYIDKMQKSTSLRVFIYVGFVFIAYGVSKMVVAYILGKDKISPEKKEKELSEARYNESKVESSKPDMHGYIGYCQRCSTPMRKINRYCHRCGMRQNIP